MLLIDFKRKKELNLIINTRSSKINKNIIKSIWINI